MYISTVFTKNWYIQTLGNLLPGYNVNTTTSPTPTLELNSSNGGLLLIGTTAVSGLVLLIVAVTLVGVFCCYATNKRKQKHNAEGNWVSHELANFYCKHATLVHICCPACMVMVRYTCAPS